MGRRSTRRPVEWVEADRDPASRIDSVAVEEPLELRIAGAPLAVTMRTPGNDVELAHGLLLSEGIIAGRADVRAAHRCSGRSSSEERADNVLDLTLAPGVSVADHLARRTVTTSACGICGTHSISEVRRRAQVVVQHDEMVVTRATAVALPELLRSEQTIFARTGGLHAAGLATPDGQLLCVREDVGRHNAVDKAIGWAVIEGRVPLAGVVLVVSGRASFELVQKAAVAGVAVLIAVSAASSLAIDLAQAAGVTLLGFTRDGRTTIYTHPHRIVVERQHERAQPV